MSAPSAMERHLSIGSAEAIFSFWQTKTATLSQSSKVALRGADRTLRFRLHHRGLPHNRRIILCCAGAFTKLRLSHFTSDRQLRERGWVTFFWDTLSIASWQKR